MSVRGERLYQVDTGNGFRLYRSADASTLPTKASALSRRLRNRDRFGGAPFAFDSSESTEPGVNHSALFIFSKEIALPLIGATGKTIWPKLPRDRRHAF
jgi:hypothetical protein